jgi:hypothetical protein
MPPLLLLLLLLLAHHDMIWHAGKQPSVQTPQNKRTCVSRIVVHMMMIAVEHQVQVCPPCCCCCCYCYLLIMIRYGTQASSQVYKPHK